MADPCYGVGSWQPQQKKKISLKPFDKIIIIIIIIKEEEEEEEREKERSACNDPCKNYVSTQKKIFP